MIIDAHVHLIGDGSSGSGCYLKLDGVRRLHAHLMLTELGISRKALVTGLDEIYANWLVRSVESSSLTCAVLLAHDKVYELDGSLSSFQSSFYVPNEYLYNVVRRSKRLLAGASIHPARPDAFDELDRAIAENAALVKLLPNCHKVYCSNAKHKKFWERMAEAKLPLLAHTGGELSVPVADKGLEDPRCLRLPLECGVKVIAAHCASSSLPFEANYCASLAEMMVEFPQLYCDNSALLTPFRSKHIEGILRAPFLERMIHGSDLPIPISGLWSFCRGQISFQEYLKSRNMINPLERDIFLKGAIGFEAGVFSRALGILSPNAIKELERKGKVD